MFQAERLSQTPSHDNAGKRNTKKSPRRSSASLFQENGLNPSRNLSPITSNTGFVFSTTASTRQMVRDQSAGQHFSLKPPPGFSSPPP